MKKFGFLILCALAFDGYCRATVIFNNINLNTEPADNVTGFGPLYDSFSTGASSFTLQDIKLNLQALQASSSTMDVAIYQDSNTSPGSLLFHIGSIADSVVEPHTASSACGFNLDYCDYAFDFPIAKGYVLSPDTRYWIGLSSTNGSSGLWVYGGEGMPGEYIANSLGVAPGSVYQMQLSGAAAPEPAPEPGYFLVHLVGGFSLCVVALKRRYRPLVR